MFRSNIHPGDCGGGEFFAMFFVIRFVSYITLFGLFFEIFFDLLFGCGGDFFPPKSLEKKQPTSSQSE